MSDKSSNLNGRPEMADTGTFFSSTAQGRYDREWSEWLDNLDKVSRRDGIAYLMRYGEAYVPCSRYGRNSSECAEVAWRLTYVLARETGEAITSDSLEGAMGWVVNDSDSVAEIIREYGHGMYR